MNNKVSKGAVPGIASEAILIGAFAIYAAVAPSTLLIPSALSPDRWDRLQARPTELETDIFARVPYTTKSPHNTFNSLPYRWDGREDSAYKYVNRCLPFLICD